MIVHDHGAFKFPNAGLIASAAGRAWTGVGAELRCHPAGEIPAICPDRMEITLAVAGNDAGLVERRGDGLFQSTTPRDGTLWLCPIGIQEDSIRISAPIPQVFHLYIDADQFAALSDQRSRPVAPGHIHYLAGLDDAFIRQAAYRMLQELRHESSGGALLAEHLSMALLMHIAGQYADAPAPLPEATGALDARRLKRVLGHIEENLETALSVAELAGIACLSRHHFARAFREATGLPPHAFVAGRRLELACRLLAASDRSLAEIAFDCRFSSQATFTRAFRRMTGLTPGDYRRRAKL